MEKRKSHTSPTMFPVHLAETISSFLHPFTSRVLQDIEQSRLIIMPDHISINQMDQHATKSTNHIPTSLFPLRQQIWPPQSIETRPGTAPGLIFHHSDFQTFLRRFKIRSGKLSHPHLGSWMYQCLFPTPPAEHIPIVLPKCRRV